jgi:hypothetical protein
MESFDWPALVDRSTGPEPEPVLLVHRHIDQQKRLVLANPPYHTISMGYAVIQHRLLSHAFFKEKAGRVGRLACGLSWHLGICYSNLQAGPGNSSPITTTVALAWINKPKTSTNVLGVINRQTYEWNILKVLYSLFFSSCFLLVLRRLYCKRFR